MIELVRARLRCGDPSLSHQRRHGGGALARSDCERFPPLHKPVPPMALRAMLNQLLRPRQHAVACRRPALNGHGSRRGRSQPRALTAMTASVRLVTFRAFRMAVTWFFTVGSARSSLRQISLLLLPCIIRASTSSCRSVRPRSPGKHRRALARRFGCAVLGVQGFRAERRCRRQRRAECAQHELARGRLWDESQRARARALWRRFRIVEGGQDDHGNRRVTLAQRFEHFKATRIGQVQVKQDEFEIRITFNSLHRNAEVRRLEYVRLALQFLQYTTQRLANEDVIIDDKNLHAKRSLRSPRIAAFIAAARQYFSTGTKAPAARSCGRPISFRTNGFPAPRFRPRRP